MKRKISILVVIFVILMLHCNFAFAETLQEQLYNFGDNKISNVGATIASYIVYAGIMVAVVVLMCKGIKFITSSPEGKADVKKELIPWAVGIVILFSIQTILQVIVDFAQNNINNLTI